MYSMDQLQWWEAGWVGVYRDIFRLNHCAIDPLLETFAGRSLQQEKITSEGIEYLGESFRELTGRL